MTHIQRCLCGAVLLALVALPFGCAGIPRLPFAEAGRTWPEAPSVARIAYLGSVSEPSDIGIQRGFFSGAIGWLTGAGDDPLVRPYAVAVFGSAPSTGPGGTPGPAVIAVADSDGHAVHVYDLGSGEHVSLRELGDTTSLATPVAVAFDAQQRLYVADSALGRVVRFSADGEFDREITRNVMRPVGLAVDAKREILYVADSGTHDVRRLTLDGEPRGLMGGPFYYPTHLSMTPDGRLLVADSLQFRVVVLSPEGKTLATIGGEGDASGDLQRPKGVAMDPDGHVYVVDALFDNVQIFDDRGEFLLAFGSAGPDDGEFALPAGLCIDERGLIYVCDSYNSRVQVFRYLGGGER